MKTLRRINVISGIAAMFLFLIMTNILYVDRTPVENKPFYYVCHSFFIVGAIFLLTATFFAVYAVFKRVKQNRLRVLMRHYLYASLAIYAVSLILGYIVKDALLWSYLPYSLLLGMFHLYFCGVKISKG